ncbi:MAG: flagellar biosynthetic protein FliO [Nannocystaceae bacterium]
MPELTDAEILLLYTGAVLAAMFVFLALLGRRLGGRASANRTVIGLGGQHRLHVLEVDGRRLLVGTGPSGPPSLLCELDDEPAWTRERERERER